MMIRTSDKDQDQNLILGLGSEPQIKIRIRASDQDQDPHLIVGTGSGLEPHIIIRIKI